MRRGTLSSTLALIALAAVFSLALGWLLTSHALMATGAAVLVFVGGRAVAGLAARKPPLAAPCLAPVPPAPNPAPRKPPLPQDAAGFVEELLSQGRYALLLRPPIARQLGQRQFQRVLQALEDGMALVPDAEVLLEPAHRPLGDESGPEEASLRAGRVVHVDRFFLDRYPVTNEQYYAFVAADGYRQAGLWDPLILPALLTFVDQTGQPGPRYWRDGRFDPDQGRHPVVGICWYEALAYARWVGKRLPTDAEWVGAGCWPVNLSGMGLSQRRFPWGDIMDRGRANLWGTGPNHTLPVDEFPDGVSVGGVYQLIGNVWEWIDGDFPPPHELAQDWLTEVPMKSLRGGAFDTYFDTQAHCQFQSADAAIARKHNVGFRCAVSVGELLLARPASEPAAHEEPAASEPMEVHS